MVRRQEGQAFKDPMVNRNQFMALNLLQPQS